MNVRTSARSRLAAAIAGIGSIALAAGGLALFSAPSASAQTTTYGHDCKSAGIKGTSLKVEPKDGTYKGSKGFEVKVTVKSSTDGQVFDFEASRGVYGVVVKGDGGREINKYDYQPDGKSSDTGLHAKANPDTQKFYNLKHITFCYNPCPPSTPPTPTKPTVPTLPTLPTKPTTPTQPTVPTQPTTPTQPTQPTVPTQPSQPTEEPSETPSTPTETPDEPGGDDETPTPGIPTDVEAGTGGDGSSGISLLGNDNGGGGGALAAGLLTLGGVLLAVGALVFGLRRGQHSI